MLWKVLFQENYDLIEKLVEKIIEFLTKGEIQ